MFGNSISLLGLWVHRVGLGWLTWDLTHSGFWLGAVAFADMFPAIVIGPFAGVFADRIDRVRLLIWTQSISSVAALLLFALVFSGLINVYLLVLIALVLGMAASFAQPARLALVPLLVRPVDMSAAVAFGSVVFNTARFVGPMIAGGIISLSDVSYTFLVNCVTYVTMVIALLGIPVGLHETKQAVKTRIWSDVVEGIRYTIDHRTIRAVMFVSLASSVLGKPVADLLPGFADHVFERGAIGLAMMTQAMGIGALSGGLLLARLNTTHHLPFITVLALLISGGLTFAFGLIGEFYLGLGILFLLSMALSGTGICTQTLVQHAVQENMRGRVMSIWGLIFRGAPAIGVLVLGSLSEISSLGFVVMLSGALSLLCGAAILRWYDHLKAVTPVADVVPESGL